MKIALRFLQVGESFEIPQLASTMRNLTVLRSSDCGVLITGEMRDDESSNWKRDVSRVSAGMLVESSGVINKIIANDNGKFSMQNEQGENIAFESSNKRGRKPKCEIAWPKGKFVLKELAEKLGISYPTLFLAFNKEKDKFENVGTKSHEGKGRAATVWKMKNG